jgi:hypothetical protein
MVERVYGHLSPDRLWDVVASVAGKGKRKRKRKRKR